MMPRALPGGFRSSWLAAVASGVVLVGAVIPLHRHDAVATKFDLVEERVWLLPPVGALRVASLGFHAMAADVVWLLTVQYIGGHFMTDSRFPELRRLLDTVVDLDPHFVEAYTLGALF